MVNRRTVITAAVVFEDDILKIRRGITTIISSAGIISIVPADPAVRYADLTGFHTQRAAIQRITLFQNAVLDPQL